LAWEWIVPAQPAIKSVGMVVHEPKRASTPLSPTASNVVRVDLARLDDLMRMVGELVVTRARLGESVTQASGGLSSNAWDDVNEANELLERQLRSIREGVMRIRLVPIGEVFERMRFAMRDIARETGKAIHLEFDGQSTEIDKLVVDRMLEPLLHLVRNAASHGIEQRSDRVAAGKAADGTIALRARAAGDRIVIEVEDNGIGIAPDVLSRMFDPFFSTKEGGSGLGLALTQQIVRDHGGYLRVDSVVGRGTTFTVSVPASG